MLPSEGTVDAQDTAYENEHAVDDLRVNANNTFTAVVNVTATSVKYQVTYTWTMLRKTWDADGAPAAIALKTSEVNQICAHAHVQDFWTEQDSGRSNVLYNYAVITVGTDDERVTQQVRWRMDSIGQPGVFGAIDAAWKRIAQVLAG